MKENMLPLLGVGAFVGMAFLYRSWRRLTIEMRHECAKAGARQLAGGGYLFDAKIVVDFNGDDTISFDLTQDCRNDIRSYKFVQSHPCFEILRNAIKQNLVFSVVFCEQCCRHTSRPHVTDYLRVVVDYDRRRGHNLGYE